MFVMPHTPFRGLLLEHSVSFSKLFMGLKLRILNTCMQEAGKSETLLTHFLVNVEYSICGDITVSECAESTFSPGTVAQRG